MAEESLRIVAGEAVVEEKAAVAASLDGIHILAVGAEQGHTLAERVTPEGVLAAEAVTGGGAEAGETLGRTRVAEGASGVHKVRTVDTFETVGQEGTVFAPLPTRLTRLVSSVAIEPEGTL
jgi:hypothetical protein